jgi:NAD(P)-dependent dehydrogenase (short-subunit alcohol dehydrogenase family)
MARDLGRYGIRAVSIAPGIFHTPLASHIPKKVMDRLN